MLNKKNTGQVLALLEEEYKDTRTALNYDSPFQLLIATMLAAQSTDKRVNIVTSELFPEFPSPADFLKMTVTELEDRIKTIGLYKSKAKNVMATCQILVRDYNSEIPMTREELVGLPGVGRKTANVVLSITTDFAAIAVDTHVFRVANRIGLAASNNVRATEEDLMKSIPRSKWSDAHHWLIWHGRLVCAARNPACQTCFLNSYCLYAQKS